MSINVTVSGNPVCIHRGRMVLSDLDQIKKNERDRRRRLRLEQVRQQSKEISNRLLERVKNITKTQLTRLEKDGKSELKQMHEQKIMDLQRKYQEDMEDIGQAHVSALLQPNLDAMVEADRRRNRSTAIERGKEARQRLKEVNKLDDPQSIQQDRLRQVREVENVRASMVANLPKRSSPKKISEQDSDSSEEDESHRITAKRKKYKKPVQKKSPAKVIVKSPDVKVVVSRQNPKTRFEPQPGPSGMQTRRQPESVSDFVSSKTVTDISDLPRTVNISESDDQEPRQPVPTVNTSSKADKLARYNPQDYKQDSVNSSDSGTPSSMSDDSSYFSDGGGEQGAAKKTPRHPTSLAGSKVQVYDHNTRQRNAYDRPTGLVERVDIRNEPNAEDLAREVLELESVESRLTNSRQINAQRRGNDAILRERVRRDYQTLLQNLDHLSREERKLRASQIHGPPYKDIHMDHARRKELQDKRQRDMALAFEKILHDSSPGPRAIIDDNPPERIVTITPRDGDEGAEDSQCAVWQESPFVQAPETTGETQQDKENEPSREEQILDMLKKVERQKRLLLREFGADLPDNILNASLKPLFHTNLPETRNAQQSQPIRREAPCSSPEIKVINMSSCDEREKSKAKKVKKKEPVPTRKIETAVQTSTLDEMGAAKHKGVQVQLVDRKSSSSSLASEETVEKPKCYGDEPRVKIVTPEVSSGSSDSIVASVVIDIGKKQVKVTPKKKKSSLKMSRRKSPRMVVKPRSIPVSKTTSPMKRPSKSAPASRQSSPKKVLSDSTRLKSPNKKIKVQVDKEKVKVLIHPSTVTSASKESSTETSQDYITPDMFESYRPYAKTLHDKKVKMKDTSDTSTSYTSPPPILPATLYRPLSNTTPILEILETSSNESIILKGKRVSPVSSPETPSPRTIAIPTNALHSRLINKMLQYSTDSTTMENTTGTFRSHEQSTPMESFSAQKTRQKSPKRPKASPEVCSCKNPGCKLLHSKLEDIEDYALKNCPEILKKYEDLQNMCTNRIASLTDLIEKVRNEQKGMELSVVEPSDESSLLLIPGPTPLRSDMHSVRRLVDSIEAIHNQLAKTLNESQRIIASEEKQSPSISTVSPETSSKSRGSNTQTTSTDSSLDIGQPPVNRTKPRVISDEPVRIAPEHLQALIRPQTAVRVKITESTLQSKSKSPEQEEDMVTKLSKEILEQSKSLEKSIPRESPTDLDESLIRKRIPSPQFPDSSSQVHTSSQEQNSDASRKEASKEVYDSLSKDSPGSPADSQPKKDNDFVPLLAGIPKVPRAPPVSQAVINRGKPPVSLIHGPYRQAIETPVHELSTIVEFDTPDAGNRSQGSVRSPTGKSNKTSSATSYPTAQPGTSPVHASRGPGRETPSGTGGFTISKSPPMKPASPAQKESSPTQITTKMAAKKSPVRVALAPVQKTTQISIKKPAAHEMTSQTDKKALETPGEPVTFEAATTSSSPGKPKTSTDTGAASKDVSTESSSTLPDISVEMKKRNLIFQVQMATKDPNHREQQPRPISPDSADPNKEKITSTSSNSFSGLSGISEITSTPTSDVLKYASSPEEMEAALKKLGLGWAITTLKKTREASALSSSSNSDITPVNTARKIISPVKKQLETNISGMPDLSDVSSISIKDASKSTERAVLLKGRTSTPNIENSNTSGEKSNSTTTSSSRASLQDPSDSIIVPNGSLTSKQKSYMKHMKGP